MTKIPSQNRLNELSAQEWLRFTKTWFVYNPPPRKKDELLHPAKYPENMIEEFIRFFTKSGEVVFDPFLGTGSTLVACHACKRNGIGIELQKKYADIAQERLNKMESQLQLTKEGAKQHCKQLVICGDSSNVEDYWKKYSLPKIDFVITSPPYGPMLQKKGLASQQREGKGLDTKYSEDKNDLGNAKSYEEFLNLLLNVFLKIKSEMKEGSYLVIILQNYMDKGNYKTLAWDFAKETSRHFQLRGERIWLQDNKTLYPYGYKYSFVPNVHHHYCLIFKKI
ncbi:MAG: DNA methyltransferase [Nanoarchaeota archaeon]